MYVGSADSTDYDQVLNEVLVGPVPVGMNRFVLEVGVCDAHAGQPCFNFQDCAACALL